MALHTTFLPTRIFFCKHWSSVILSTVDVNQVGNAVAIRSVVEEFKLKIIQDVNCMKRLVQKASDDYYTLFKALTFLKHTGNVTVLLKLLKDDYARIEEDFPVKRANLVISILEEFLFVD